MSFDERVINELVQMGKVSTDQLDRAHETASDRGLRLTDALVHLQMAEQGDIITTGDGAVPRTAVARGCRHRRGECEISRWNSP